MIDMWVDTLVREVGKGRDPEAVLSDFRESMGEERTLEIQAAFERSIQRIRDIREPRALVDSTGHVDWYAGPQDGDWAWPALEHYLLEGKDEPWDKGVVKSVDDASSKILSNCHPPGKAEFATRGLVLGHVQSGKTANFTALIAKAADVGYRVFIVLSGLYNSLRKQTQKRLDQELVNLNPDRWLSLTDRDRDFGDQTLNADFVVQDGGNSALLGGVQHRSLIVLKKNHRRLERLIRWLRSAEPSLLRACPVMVIDDEADQASINASRYEHERTRINELLIELLSILPRHAYVGYTATPFANVLVDPGTDEGLYPRHFIVTLPKPDSYFGAEKLFGRSAMTEWSEEEGADPIDVIRHVDDDEVSHVRPLSAAAVDEFEPALVPSLDESLRYFWLACAARRVRGQGDDHTTMLVHTHQRIAVHERFLPLVVDARDRVRDSLKRGERAEWEEMEELWEREYARAPADPAFPDRTLFNDLRGELIGVLEDCEVVVENGESEDRLDFDNDRRIRIVIGGTTLSRGLTLEGLVVSYFVRSARAYDTLLQMGRWFGYRQGYEDLPRIWITEDLEKDFRTLALVEAEIRADIQRYENTGMTPEQLAVRIRVHPTLAVTSRYKMTAAQTVKVSYAGTRVQTTAFHHDNADVLQSNLQGTRKFLSSAAPEADDFQVGEPLPRGRALLEGVSGSEVLDFLSEYRFHSGNRQFAEGHVLEYIRRRLAGGGLKKWNVGVVGRGSQLNESEEDIGLGFSVYPVTRTRLASQPDYADIGVLTSAPDFELDIDPDEERERPLLLVYVIDKDSEPSKQAEGSRRSLDAEEHVVGLALSIPSTDPDLDRASYVAVDLPTEPDVPDEEYASIPEVEEEAKP